MSPGSEDSATLASSTASRGGQQLYGWWPSENPPVPRGKLPRLQQKKAVGEALKITKKYRTSRARALREWAEIAVIEGRETRAQRLLQESLRVADAQEAQDS